MQYNIHKQLLVISVVEGHHQRWRGRRGWRECVRGRQEDREREKEVGERGLLKSENREIRTNTLAIERVLGERYEQRCKQSVNVR